MSFRLEDNLGGSGLSLAESWWKFLWRLNLPLKVKLFMWKACHNWIPTHVNLANHGVQLNTVCPLCLKSNETSLHALWFCDTLRCIRVDSCLRGGGGRRILEEASFLDWRYMKISLKTLLHCLV